MRYDAMRYGECSRTAADGVKVLAALKPATNVSYYVLDQTDDKSVDSAIAAIYAAHKRIDILVNNAGAVKGWGTTAQETLTADVIELHNINTVGPIRLIL